MGVRAHSRVTSLFLFNVKLGEKIRPTHEVRQTVSWVWLAVHELVFFAPRPVQLLLSCASSHQPVIFTAAARTTRWAIILNFPSLATAHASFQHVLHFIFDSPVPPFLHARTWFRDFQLRKVLLLLSCRVQLDSIYWNPPFCWNIAATSKIEPSSIWWTGWFKFAALGISP